jgi:GTPase
MKCNENTKSGYIAISGKPNVGKSTLLNGILKRKIAITSRKPQTTRQSILGIKTCDDVQMLFVDTPGIHLKKNTKMNQRMNSIAKSALTDVNMVLFVTDLTWDEQDMHVLDLMRELSVPVILVVNKVDHLKDKDELLPLLQQRSELMPFEDVIPISALKQQQINELEKKVVSLLPTGMHYYSPEQFTNRSDSFMIAEMVREKLMRLLGQEIPYRTAVTVERMEETKKILKIHVIIWVERENHKHIVIGRGGEKLKQIGTEARADIEKYFDKKVLLKSWVKVKAGWSDNLDFLNRTDLGK